MSIMTLKMFQNEANYKLRALKISAIAIFSVVIVEVTVGFLVNSLAIVSDGLHALLDALSTIMLFFAVRAAIKPPDEEHTYGHEKFETIGGLIGGIALIGVAILIFYEAAMRLLAAPVLNSNIEFAGFIAITYALFIAALRVTIFRKSQHIQSQSMKAGLYDAISDLSSTIIALLGFGLATLGFYSGDAFASIFLGILLTYLSAKLVKSSISELSDSVSKDLIDKARSIIHDCNGVLKTRDLKVRKVGSKVFVESSVQVPFLMSLDEAHSLTSKIEACLGDSLGNVEATIHVEPSVEGKKMGSLIKKLATVEGVKEVHEISTHYVEGKLYVTLHAYVNPELSVEDSHKISDAVEKQIRSAIKQIEHVTVHIEPSNATITEEEVHDLIEKIAYEAAKNTGEKLQIENVVTYFAEDKRFINVDCSFTNLIKIKDAHKIVSQIEKDIKEHFANAEVTVHMEPESKQARGKN
jgi:cation diffusion facilitator family transporter